MKTVILLLALVFSIYTASGNTNRDTTVHRASSDICIGGFGDASLFSINYEFITSINSVFALTYGFGFGYNPGNPKIDIISCALFRICGKIGGPFVTYPAHITINIGKGIVYSEFGLGYVIFDGIEINNGLFFSTLGFRVLPFEPGNLVLRLYIDIPINNIPDDIKFIPVGISLGVSL